MRDKKGQVVGETMEWFIAIVIIFFLMVSLIFLSVFYSPSEIEIENKTETAHYAFEGKYGVNPVCKIAYEEVKNAAT